MFGMMGGMGMGGMVRQPTLCLLVARVLCCERLPGSSSSATALRCRQLVHGLRTERTTQASSGRLNVPWLLALLCETDGSALGTTQGGVTGMTCYATIDLQKSHTDTTACLPACLIDRLLVLCAGCCALVLLRGRVLFC